MTIVYSIMWLLIAVILFSMGIKEQKIYIVFSMYFLFNCVWWGISAFVKADMFHGSLGWVFRGVTAVFLIIGIVYYLMYMDKDKKKKEKE